MESSNIGSSAACGELIHQQRMGSCELNFGVAADEAQDERVGPFSLEEVAVCLHRESKFCHFFWSPPPSSKKGPDTFQILFERYFPREDAAATTANVINYSVYTSHQTL